MSEMLQVDVDGPIAKLTMTRPGKRNAMCDELLSALDAFYSKPPEKLRVAILTGIEGHYCSGLDLSEHIHRSAEENLYHSRHWHSVMEKIQFGGDFVFAKVVVDSVLAGVQFDVVKLIEGNGTAGAGDGAVI